MTDIASYNTSTDYEALYELAKKQRILCIIGVNDNVAVTNYSEYYPDRITILSIGYCFINGESLKQFIKECEKMNVRWLVPTDYKEPTLLERGLDGDKEAARQFLYEAGVIDKEGNLMPWLQSLNEDSN